MMARGTSQLLGQTDAQKRPAPFKTELEAVEWAHIHLQSWLEGKKARDKNWSPSRASRVAGI
jgi:hypothetical protein